MSVILR